jgi:heptosyltransferase-3
MPYRILIVRAGALGDTLLTIPALRALRRQHSDTSITAVGSPTTWEVVGDLVDRRLSVDARATAGLVGGTPTLESLQLVRDHDLAVLWITRVLHPSLLDTGVPVVHATPYPPPGLHTAVWLAETLGLVINPTPSPFFPLSFTEQAAGEALLAPYKGQRPIIIHPGAGAHWKRWPVDHFAAVITALRDRDHAVLLLEGPADAEVVAEVNLRVDLPVPVLRDIPLRTVAALAASASAYLGNDSGITHLAAMAGACTVALFGPTDPANWAPMGEHVRVLRTCAVRAAYQGQIRACDDKNCMAAIGVRQVVEASVQCQKPC